MPVRKTPGGSRNISANSRRKSENLDDVAVHALPASIQEELGEHNPNEQEKPFWESLVHNPLFEMSFAVVIVLNAAQMGTSVEFPEAPFSHVWHALEHIFTAVFFLEFVVKVVGLRLEYFRCHWNKMDFILVWIAVVDNWILAIVLGGGNMEQFTVLRIFRLLRIGRMFKMLRLNREILVLLEGIFASLRSMVSVGILLSIIIYAVALFCCEMMGTGGLAEGESWDSDYYFGSLPKAWLTLFDMVILAEWAEVARPLSEEHPWMVLFLAAFVMLNAFGIMNVIIGVLMEQTDRAIHKMKEGDLARQRQRQIEHVQQLAGLVAPDNGGVCVANGDDIFSPEHLETAGMREAFRDIGLPRNFTGEELHVMLDRDGSGQITINEFVLSMWRLIYSDDFQLKCLQQMSVNMIMQQVNQLSVSLEVQLNAVQQSLKDELHRCHADLALKIDQLGTVVVVEESKGGVAPECRGPEHLLQNATVDSPTLIDPLKVAPPPTDTDRVYESSPNPFDNTDSVSADFRTQGAMGTLGVLGALGTLDAGTSDAPVSATRPSPTRLTRRSPLYDQGGPRRDLFHPSEKFSKNELARDTTPGLFGRTGACPPPSPLHFPRPGMKETKLVL